MKWNTIWWCPLVLYLLSAYVFNNQSKTTRCIVWMFIIECCTITTTLTLVAWIHSIFLVCMKPHRWNVKQKKEEKDLLFAINVRSFFKHLLLRHVFYVFIRVHNTTQKEIAFSFYFLYIFWHFYYKRT